MPDFVNGLPVHIFLIHAVVVLVPLTALGAVIIAIWPAARRRHGWLVVIFAAFVTALTPLASASGEDLQRRLPDNPLIAAHQQLGDQLIFFVGPMLLALLALMTAHSATVRVSVMAQEGAGAAQDPKRARMILAVTAVLAVGLSVAATVHVVRVGETGSRAVWDGVQEQPVR